MAVFSRTWWGKRFIEALEEFTDDARLGRGRSYARGGKILKYQIDNGQVTATVRGSINPYFGVYKEPKYQTSIEITKISKEKWSKVINTISVRAGFVAKLLMNEMPDNIETVFSEMALHLLPHNEKDIKTECSCPDWANPCKHIAGVYYLVASELDNDPFLMFELRGLSRIDLQTELRKSPLGKLLSEELDKKEPMLEEADTYYTEPATEEIKDSLSIKEFWRGEKMLPQAIEPISSSGVSAVLIKKQGDYPAFWDIDNSFVEVMEQIYAQIRTKNRASM
ncbi:MAG: SWIM zinc finger family protein [Nitrospirae bacterium]|nr:SWIM zinc finger family protein [Nitrospirota bacterium]